MTETVLYASLREAVDEVLETMFFTQTEGPADPDRPPEELIVARVDFEGNPPGTLRLRITRQAACRMAADFLGEEECELAAARITEVVAELANMICGSVLSRVESETPFRLSPPAVAAAIGPVAEPGAAGIEYQAQLPGGALRVMFQEGGTAA